MIHANNLIHFYGKERAIDGISLRVAPGEFVALTGESGSGKSTLLAILSTLLRPDSGELRIDGKPAKEWGDLNRFRREYIGFVFQFHYLIPYLSVAENVALAAGRERREAIPELLDRLGIAEIAPKKADEISGGQRQRAAIARAVANAPKILFADEPTGNLDSKNSRKVFDLFRQIAAEGTTLVVATHDRTLAREADRVLEIKDGRLV
ncbi:ABC transporter ATP-binding protein [Nitratifractor sp.]|uniref:ABC transporter ATP-binding protein n=1 Tax=Nitratifractor sp. TaxID=2268144 RepID=UPI0025F90039|nr:ABC transporter ATP-binding protein [Nitratifractor sp.]